MMYMYPIVVSSPIYIMSRLRVDMGTTIRFEDDTNIELDEADINVYENTIAFSVEGEITDIPSGILDEFIGDQLNPVEITFERE